MKKVIVIVGATAVGKTDLSIKLAKYFNGEVINADSSSFKRGLNVGTAKIKIDEMNGVKHHMIDIIDPLDDYSIKDFQINGRKLIDDINVPFVVGGSGLYINSLIQDYSLESTPRNESIYEHLSNQDLYNELKTLNKEVALKTHMNNRRRVIRYLELVKSQGDVVVKVPKYLYDVLIINCIRSRDILYNRINERFDIMIKNNFIEECINLLAKGIDLSKIKDIGYFEIGEYLDNKISLEQAGEIIKQKTRNLAKRQITWFKNKMNTFEVDMDNYNIEDLYKLISDFIN